MKFFATASSFALRSAALGTSVCVAVACGTRVQYGANVAKAREEQKVQASADANPSDDPIVFSDGTQNGSGADGATIGATGKSGAANSSGASGGGGAALTCFGAAPDLDDGLQKFCAIADPALRDAFQTTFAAICDQKRLANLFLAPCEWTGAGDSTKFRRVLAKTALDDQTSQDFHFYSAYAVTTASNMEGMAALVKRELTDPDYSKTFVAIKNSRVYDVAENTDGTIDYTAELASSSATVKFRARVVFMPLGENLTAVFDYGLSDFVVVKEHHFLHLIRKLDEGSSRVIGIDEKVIGDGGNHAVAYTNLTDVLKQRMERDLENSKRD